MLTGYFTEMPLSSYPEAEARKVQPDDHPARTSGETTLLFSNKFFDPAEASRLYGERLREYRYAEEVGFDGLMTNEHHTGAFCMQTRCNMMSMAIAAQTSTAKIIQLGNPLPLWSNPVQLAEELAMIDLISNGRLISGILRGGGTEQLANNVNPAFNRDLFVEAHDLLIKTWTVPGPFRWEGEHFQFRVVNPWALPLQKPHPRIFVPGVVSPETIIWAAQHAYPFVVLNQPIAQTQRIWKMYDDEAERSGYTAGSEHRGYLVRCHVQSTEEKAVANARNFVWMRGEFTGIANQVWVGPTGYSSWESREAVRSLWSRPSEGVADLAGGMTLIAGTPEQAIERLKVLMEETRPGTLIFWANDGRIDHADSMECIELLGKEVLPAVRSIADDLGLASPFDIDAPVSLGRDEVTGMGFVDVDSHLLECEETWSYLDPGEERFRPKTVQFAETLVNLGSVITNSSAVPPTSMWVVEDTWSTRLPANSDKTGHANIFDPGATELSDPTKRLADLDALGIDAQLLLSTFFIVVELDNPLAEAALVRSYNRWVADTTDGHLDRFRWALRPPLRMLERAFEELEFGAAHGAAGLHVRGIEHGMFLSDPYFYPLYERAQDLDLAIFVHLGAAVRRVDSAPIGRGVPSPPAFMENVHKVMAGFHAVISSDLHKRFPRLRWGFLEAGATWAPAVLQQHRRLVASASSEFLKLLPMSPEDLEEKNIFIACQADEDIGYLTGVLGENVLCIGSDYGHNDIGAELGAHASIMARSDISQTAARKIVDTNGRKLLGIPTSALGRHREISPEPERLPYVRGASTADARPVLRSSS